MPPVHALGTFKPVQLLGTMLARKSASLGSPGSVWRVTVPFVRLLINRIVFPLVMVMVPLENTHSVLACVQLVLGDTGTNVGTNSVTVA